MRYLHTAPDKVRLEGESSTSTSFQRTADSEDPFTPDICTATSMTMEDVYNTLIDKDLISVRSAFPPPPKLLPGQSMKFPKGRKNGIARRHLIRVQTQDDDVNKAPFVSPTNYEIHWNREQVTAYLEKWESKGYLKIKPEKLKWSPFLLSRSKTARRRRRRSNGCGRI